ncbi:Hypothetical protein ACGLYG10_2556 [Actinomyces glycerinitolerans]|uniref:Lipoprotein n=1 Tax=Actinomyces glycerinitolerans TaxID=1892869 RepID=A0A1M4S241_9ACTO|nr:Hypothetical protein ACGLYG10_2556 [Actinomyces glycerinitolerans]
MRFGVRKRAGAVVGAVLLAGASLMACSSGSDEGGLDIPTFDPEAMASEDAAASAAAAEASASAAASAAAAGVVSAESLTDAELGYYVVSIPEDLDEAQAQVLADYVAYDKATWRVWFTGEGIDDVALVATGDLLDRIYENYSNLNGEHSNPPVSVGISEVTITDDGTLASITTCLDRTQTTRSDADGNDITDPEVQALVEFSIQMVPDAEGNWVAYEETAVSENECTTEQS